MIDFWIGVLGNLVASVITAMIAWFWKIRPHFQRMHERLDAQEHVLNLIPKAGT